jgi:hypothetical protein
VVGAGGELQLLDGGFEEPVAGFVQAAVLLDLRRTDVVVEHGSIATVAGGLALPGFGDALPDLLGCFSWSTVGQLVVLDAWYFQMNVDAVEQWPGNAFLIAGDRRWRAGAVLDRVPGEATGTPLRCLFMISA